MSTPKPKAATILSTYRILTRLINNIPSKQERIKNLTTLRNTYRTNAKSIASNDVEKINACIQEAGEKIAYLRIITPKGSGSNSSNSSSNASDGSSGSSTSSNTSTNNTGTTRFIYTKDGVVELDGNGKGGTTRDANGRVTSNWDGKNLDPCSIKTHNGQLKRMGFVNNLHAKGIF